MPAVAKRLLWVGLAAGLAAAYWIAWRAPAVGTFHDDGVYLVTAKALAEGKGYRIVSLPSEIPQTKYPVLFPMALAGVWKLWPDFPGNVPLLKLLPLACGILWLLIVYRLAREQSLPAHIAGGICLLTAAAPWVIYLSTALLSETLFAALLTASLLYLSRADRSPPTGFRDLMLSALFAALAFHTRSLGLAMVIAGPLFLLARGRRREAVQFACVAGLSCAPWILWTKAAAGVTALSDAYYSTENYQGWNILFNFSLSQKFHIAAQNAIVLILSPVGLLGWPMHGVFILPAGALGLWMLRGLVIQGLTPAALLLTVYAALVVCWAWSPGRFVAPILPLLLIPSAIRIRNLRPRVQQVVCALLISGVALSVLSASRRTLRLGDAMPGLAETDSFHRLSAQLQWTRQNTPPSAVLAGNLDPLYYLYTGRKAVRGFHSEPYQLIYAQEGDPIGTGPQSLDNLCRASASFWIESPNSGFLEGKHLSGLQSNLHQRFPRTLPKLFDQYGTHRIYGVHCQETIGGLR